MNLATTWALFETMALPPHRISEAQRFELKKVFYAGASAMFGLLINVQEEEDDDIALASIAALERECLVFANSLPAGPSQPPSHPNQQH